MARHRLELTSDETREVEELLGVCSRSQGQYLMPEHGRGSWATTYSDEFVAAATKIYQIFRSAKKAPPFPADASSRYQLSMVFDLMADAFYSRNIRSCRGSSMDRDTVRYLWEAHIHRRL